MSALYPSFKKLLLDGDIDLVNDTIKAALVSSSYSYNSSHDFWDDVSSNVVGTPATLAGKSTTAGVFDANDVTYTSVSGNQVTSIVLFKDTGQASTSPLIAHIDGISVTPNGGDISVTWDNGANKIFAL